jgi:hypothetical protein
MTGTCCPKRQPMDHIHDADGIANIPNRFPCADSSENPVPDKALKFGTRLRVERLTGKRTVSWPRSRLGMRTYRLKGSAE